MHELDYLKEKVEDLESRLSALEEMLAKTPKCKCCGQLMPPEHVLDDMCVPCDVARSG